MKGKSTRSIHGRRDKQFGSSVYPIFPTTTFAVEKAEDYNRQSNYGDEFYMYHRYGNPTTRNVEEKLAKLENAEDAVLFGSGMAAITTALLTFLSSGDTIVVSRKVYGGTYRFLRDIAPRFGIKAVFLDNDHLSAVERYAPDAKVLYFETPVNPTTECVPIREMAAAAKRIGAVSMIDNTFASPINQNPVDLGVDLVIHSATKYIGGHTDVMAGAVIGAQSLIEKVYGTLKILGGIVNPLDAYLLDRSLKTLKVRVEAQNANAQKVAEFFESEPHVQRVLYPGLKSSPTHAVAQSQMHGFGAMLCIELADFEAAKRFCDHLQVALNATSLGGVETLVCIPVLTSHTNMSDAELDAAGVTRGMVRISIGLEDADDLIEDFKQALCHS
jgi:cystathionine beta-lyase/cystathionine gamma-synthase